MAESSRIIHQCEIVREENIDFHDTAFFKEQRHERLPTPAEIRDRNFEIHGQYEVGQRAPLVWFEEVGLVVKYGSWIDIAEGQCLRWFNEHMRDEVPMPEVFGWRHDGGEVFIYMDIIDGDTMKVAKPHLTTEELDGICEELKRCVNAWRALRQESEPYFIGHIGHQGVHDMLFRERNQFNAGPFDSVKAFHDALLRLFSSHMPADWDPRKELDFASGLNDDQAVVFSHSDLCFQNIMITPAREGEPRRLAAIIDWTQSGWYPAQWEYMKSVNMCENTSDGKDTVWLNKVMEPADEEYDNSWGEVAAHCLF